MRSFVTKLIFISCTLPSSALAQNLPQDAAQNLPKDLARENPMETVVVEATRLAQDRYEVGSSLFLLDGEDIEASGYDFLVDALAAVPGLTVNQNGPFGGSASVRIRGASSDQTLVLIDGLTVNDASTPGGGFNFARIDPASIERVEVLNGPQSTLWGSDAIGGVINIVTKQSSDPLEGDLFVEYGSEQTTRGGASLAGSNEAGHFRIGVASTRSDGISKADENNGNSEQDRYESVNINARGGLELPGNALLDVLLNHTSAEAEFDSFSFGAQGNVADGDEFSETDELSGQLRLTVPALDGRMINTLAIGYAEIERENLTNGVSSFSAEGERQVYRLQTRYSIDDAHRVAIGFEREDTESGSSDDSTQSYYGLYEVRPTHRLTLTLGIRADDIDDIGTEVTGRAATAFRLSDTFTLRGSWAEGFKAPSLFQTTFFCCGATAANPDLQAEESEGYDLGFDWRAASGQTSISATYFNQDTDNQISFSFALGGYENIDTVRSEGLELAVAHRWSDTLETALTYAYIDAEDGDGNALVRVPQQTADLRATYQATPAFSLTATLRYNDREPDPNGTLEDWIRADLSANYELRENLSLFLRIENVGDTEYQQILGYGTPDRHYSAGIRTRF